MIKIHVIFLTLLVLVFWLSYSTRKYSLAYPCLQGDEVAFVSVLIYCSVPCSARCVLLSNPEGSIFQHECSDPYTVIITPCNTISKAPWGPSLLDEKHYKNERYVHNG